MTDAIAVAQRAEPGPSTQLLALYAKADAEPDALAKAEKLTLEMIAETAGWFEMGDAQADRAAEVVRQWWIARVREGVGEEEAEEFEQRWALAFERAKPAPEAKGAKPATTYRELKAGLEADAANAKAAEPAAEAKAGTALVAPSELLVVEPKLALPEAIKTMNDKHAVISNLGGKCVVMEWVPSAIMPGAKELAYQSFTSLRERYANRHVDLEGSRGREPLAMYWLTHPQRRQYEGLDLVPNGPSVLSGGYLNLWRGWGVEPRKGSWR
jgi:hypothetical protein